MVQRISSVWVIPVLVGDFRGNQLVLPLEFGDPFHVLESLRGGGSIIQWEWLTMEFNPW